MDKNKKLFPQRLWDLVNSNRYSQFLRWSDDGQRVYLNRAEFEEQYLRTPHNQFHTQKAISFVRQMNMYGFKKVDDFHYENDNFKRDCHHLIKNMIRRNSNKPQTSTADIQSLRSGPSNSVAQASLSAPNDGGFIPSHLDNRSIERMRLQPINENEGRPSMINPSSNHDSLQILSRQLASINQMNPGLMMSMLPRPTINTALQQQQDANLASQTGGAQSLAQSSLASTLYQRLALLSEQQRQQLLQHQERQLQQQQQASSSLDQSTFYQHHNQARNSEMGRQQLAQEHSPMLSAAITGSSFETSFLEQQRALMADRFPQAPQYQQSQSQQQHQHQLSAFDLSRDPANASSSSQSLTAQQILQQTLVGSLMQLRVEQTPQPLNHYLVRDLHEREPVVNYPLANGGIASGSSSTHSFQHDLRPLDLNANSSASSTPGHTRSHSTASSNNRITNNTCHERPDMSSMVYSSELASEGGYLFSLRNILSGTENENGSSSDSNEGGGGGFNLNRCLAGTRGYGPSNACHPGPSSSSPCVNRRSDEFGDSVINLVSKRYSNKSV